MARTDFDEQLASLRANVDQVVALLREHGEDHWLSWAARCQRELDGHNSQALDHILGAYGGMGSFNDLLILASNGHVIQPQDEAAVNDHLAHLRTAIWTRATALRHEIR